MNTPDKPSFAELEKKFKFMTDFTQSWEYWIGPDNGLKFVSQSCRNHTGYTREAFIQNPNLLLDIVHPDDKKTITRHIRDDMNAPGHVDLEFRIIDRGGNTRWISHTCQPVYDENHAFCGRRASNREITHLKKAEAQRDRAIEELQQTTSLLNTVLDAIPDVIGVQDPHHNIIRYNKAGYEFLGIQPADAHGKKCYELIGRRTPCEICATTEVYRTKQVAKVQKYVPELDAWFDVRAYPVLNEDNEIVQVIEHLRDITKEKTAEKRLKEAQERLVTILDSIDAHIYVADLESYEILFMNKKMIEDFQGDLVGTICYESFRGETRPCSNCTNVFIADENFKPKGVYTWQGQNPVTNRWYLNFDRAIKWVDGRTVRIQIATDITNEKNSQKQRIQMEQQLQQAHKMEAIGTLAGGIAHDFNNLMMGIQGRASLLSTHLEPSHPQQETIREIEAHVLSATDLTKQLLGLARGGKYEVAPLDINAIVRDSAKMFGRTRKEIQIDIKTCPGPVVVEVDRSQIEQVLLNMFVNAWHAMTGHGVMSLETSRFKLNREKSGPHQIEPGDYVKITVMDNGSGMDEDTLQRVFDPFFTTKDKSRGTGLGLASAYGIVKNHGGMITVDSSVGIGTRFSIHLPLSDRTIESPVEQKDTIVSGSERILLVDDEEMIADVGKAMLERMGYHTRIAIGGKQAVETIARVGSEIDLVILDMIMPEMDGGETFDKIREIRADVPVILSSGYSVDGKASEILNRGCDGFIQKPFNMAELSGKIRQILDQKQTQPPTAPNDR